MCMIEYMQLITELKSIRYDLTERMIVDNIQKIASESAYTTHDVLNLCIVRAKRGELLLWENEGVKINENNS